MILCEGLGYLASYFKTIWHIIRQCQCPLYSLYNIIYKQSLNLQLYESWDTIFAIWTKYHFSWILKDAERNFREVCAKRLQCWYKMITMYISLVINFCIVHFMTVRQFCKVKIVISNQRYHFTFDYDASWLAI